jgi:hypothetical protein
MRRNIFAMRGAACWKSRAAAHALQGDSVPDATGVAKLRRSTGRKSAKGRTNDEQRIE